MVDCELKSNVNVLIENDSNRFEQLLKYEKQKQEKFKYWLCNIVKLQQYLPIFIKNEYNDITMVEYIDEDVIRNELKITSHIHVGLLLTHINQFKRMRHQFNALFTTHKILQPFQQKLINNGILTINDLKKCIKTNEDIKKILQINNKQQMQQILSIIHMQNTTNSLPTPTAPATNPIYCYSVSQLWKYRKSFLNSNFDDLIADDDNFHEINGILINNMYRLETNRILTEISQTTIHFKKGKKTMDDFVRGMNVGLNINKKNRTKKTNKYSDNWEYRKISKYTGFMHEPKPITSFNEFPDWIRNGCIKNGINKFNILQNKIMSDLCLGNDSIIISSAGSGKTMAIIMSSFYKLYIQKAPTHIMFIVVDHIHVKILIQLCKRLGEYVPDLNVFEQVRGSRYINNKQLNEGRNIFICTPGKAVNLCENGGYRLTDNLVSVMIFDCDSLLVHPLVLKLKSTFKWIADGVNVNFMGCSMCNEMEMNMKLLIDWQSVKKKYMVNEYNNLKFWFVNCGQKHERVRTLSELCKVNPYKQGVIFCSMAYQAKIVKDALNALDEEEIGVFESVILESGGVDDVDEIIDMYNEGSIQYIIAYEYSPIHMLYKLNVDLLKVIINFGMKSSCMYLKRGNIGKYVSCKKKIHFISIIDDDQKEIYQQIEENCKVKLSELPSNIADVLCDDNDDISENNNGIVRNENDIL